MPTSMRLLSQVRGGSAGCVAQAASASAGTTFSRRQNLASSQARRIRLAIDGWRGDGAGVMAWGQCHGIGRRTNVASVSRPKPNDTLCTDEAMRAATHVADPGPRARQYPSNPGALRGPLVARLLLPEAPRGWRGYKPGSVCAGGMSPTPVIAPGRPYDSMGKALGIRCLRRPKPKKKARNLLSLRCRKVHNVPRKKNLLIRINRSRWQPAGRRCCFSMVSVARRFLLAMCLPPRAPGAYGRKAVITLPGLRRVPRTPVSILHGVGNVTGKPELCSSPRMQ